MKKVIRIIIIVVVLLLAFSLLINLFTFKKEKHHILTKKFHLPITEQYEILFFENVGGDLSVRHCYAELKVKQNEFDSFLLQIKKAGYSSVSSLEIYESFFQKNEWITGENITQSYENCVVEYRFPFFGDRIHMHIFVTDARDGYHHIYLSRN